MASNTLRHLVASVTNIDAVRIDHTQRVEPFLLSEPLPAANRVHSEVEFFDQIVQGIYRAGLSLATAATEVSETTAATIDEALVALDEVVRHIHREVCAMRAAVQAD
jgi:hypothetical protein